MIMTLSVSVSSALSVSHESEDSPAYTNEPFALYALMMPSSVSCVHNRVQIRTWILRMGMGMGMEWTTVNHRRNGDGDGVDDGQSSTFHHFIFMSYV